MSSKKFPWFVSGDVDGFFGLFTDNLLQLMLIMVLCTTVCGFDSKLLNGQVMTGAAVSLIFGNLFYAWQARKLAIKTGNPAITALPYGINTTTVVAFIFLIMGPVYQKTGDPVLAWKTGVFACLISGILETIGAYCCDWLRKNAPRAALLSALAGVAISFIAMGFVFQIFASPIIAIAPALLLIAIYGAKINFPARIPGGMIAVLMGTLAAWISRWMGFEFFVPLEEPWEPKLYLPIPMCGDLFAFILSGDGWQYFAVIIPMAIFSVVGSLENLESADAGGDHFPTRSSLLVNGLGSTAAALFGSPFPTTIYIGHPGWKQMGARHGYSILNGVIVTILVFIGGITLILRVVPLEALLGILLWIGLIMTSQAFQASPSRHTMAVSIGLIPCIAAWVLLEIETALQKAGTTLFDVAPKFGDSLYIYGLIALSQGFILTGILLSAICVFCIEHQFLKAAAWCAVAALLSYFGIIHAFTLTERGIDSLYALNAAPQFVVAYGFTALLFVGLQFFSKRENSSSKKDIS